MTEEPNEPNQESKPEAAAPPQYGDKGNLASGQAESPVSEPVAALVDASLADRVIATLIDVAVMIVVNFVPVIGQLASLAYLVLRDSLPFLDGQSLGKKAMKIRAVTGDGKGLSGNWGPGVIRNVVLLIPLFGFVELFVLITRQGKEGGMLRLGDEWGKTRVIKAS